jgi:ATP-dependent helicase HrpB
MPLTPLPIDEVLPELVETLRTHSAAVLHAPTGAGKTTRVAPALWDAGLSGEKQIVMLEPRRLAARAAARRMAFERGDQVGGLIGYQVRFDSRASRETKLLTVTDGILLRRLQDDPFLEDVGIVIFDEFHERGLESDVCLAMTRRIQRDVRPDLKIVVMSATLEAEPIADYLDNGPIVRSEGRLHPVEIQYLRKRDERNLEDQIAAHLPRILEQTSGDVLVFLPGVGEIFRTERTLSPLAERHNLALMVLYGDLAAEKQDEVLQPGPLRKVVLATNVAETSVTIGGVTAVIDSGLARMMQFDPSAGLDRLELVPISRASADQRSGRAGRTQPGVCLRLWEERGHRVRPEFDTAEIHRVDLSGIALQLKVWGESDLAAFPWYEPPGEHALEQAQRLLARLGALDSTGPTVLGMTMSRLPVAPRLARLLVEGHRLGLSDRAALVAALISERSPFRRHGQARLLPRGGAVLRSDSDLLDLLTAFEEALVGRFGEARFGQYDRGAGRNVQRIAGQLARLIDEQLGPARPFTDDEERSPEELLRQALLVAYPDRLAKRRDTGKPQALMVGGRGVQLGPQSSVLDAELFLCIDVDDKSANATVRMASAVEREWLPEEQLRREDALFFHPTQKQVVARRRVYWDDLIVSETPIPVTPGSEAGQVLREAARAHWEQVFPKQDRDLTEFLARVRCLADWRPDLSLPKLEESDLQEVLSDLCASCRSFEELRCADWLSVVRGRFDHQQLQTLDREAPERLSVPGGSQIRLSYEPGKPPVLAVKIQQLFGMRETPRIAGGRVPVLLHLLAPNMRPQQVTDDLASFWKNTYPQVRKDLRRRYSKHPWPEDPLAAPPRR